MVNDNAGSAEVSRRGGASAPRICMRAVVLRRKDSSGMPVWRERQCQYSGDGAENATVLRVARTANVLGNVRARRKFQRASNRCGARARRASARV